MSTNISVVATKTSNEETFIDDPEFTIKEYYSYYRFKKYIYESETDDTLNAKSINIFSKMYLPDNVSLLYVSKSHFILLHDHIAIYESNNSGSFSSNELDKTITILKHILDMDGAKHLSLRKKIYFIFNDETKEENKLHTIEMLKNSASEYEIIEDFSKKLKKVPFLEESKIFTKRIINVAIQTVIFLFAIYTAQNNMFSVIFKNDLKTLNKEIKTMKFKTIKIKKDIKREQKSFDKIRYCK